MRDDDTMPVTDYLGGDLPYADRLFERNIAIVSGSAGTSLIRANSVLVRIDPDTVGESAKLIIEAGQSIGQDFRIVPAGADFRDDRFEQVPERPSIAGSTLQVVIEPSEQKQPDGVRRTLRFWSSRAVTAAIGALVSAGFEAFFNSVFMANNVFLGNPGGYAANGGGYAANPGGYAANATVAAPATAGPSWNTALGLKDGRRPLVLVVDTGLQTTSGDCAATARSPLHNRLTPDHVKVHAPWRDFEPPLDPSTPVIADDEDEPDDDRVTAAGSGSVDLAGGHGTFIAGLISRLAPDTDIHIEGALSSFGEGDEHSIAAAIERAVERVGRPFDVISLSLGTYTHDDREPEALMTTIRAQIERGTVVVASAGNNNSPRRQYPAADSSVVGVGALDHASKAPFSNYGPWVDACAPGVDVTSTYLYHVETAAPHRVYDGWATWSGTSFSAPKVAAAIVRDQAVNKRTAKESWADLSSWRKYRYPDLGIVVNLD